MTEIINPSLFKNGELCLPESLEPEEWKQVHAQLTQAKHKVKKWHKASREYGQENYGIEFAAEWEAQLEFNMGLPSPTTDKPNLNPEDKSRVFVSIEGINQQFLMWERKMGDEIKTWDKPKLKRALEYLSPIEKQAQQIRELLS
jgi:hypothetical protein